MGTRHNIVIHGLSQSGLQTVNLTINKAVLTWRKPVPCTTARLAIGHIGEHGKMLALPWLLAQVCLAFKNPTPSGSKECCAQHTS